MAETVATILQEIGSAAATDAAIWVASNAAAINTALAFSASAISSNYQRRKAQRLARDAYNASLEDRLVMTPVANGARSRCYGRVRNVGGVVFKATHGANSEFYTLVVSLAGHEIDGIEKIYFDDVEIALDGSGYVQTAPWNGEKPADAFDSVTVAAGAGSRVLAHVPIAGSIVATYRAGEGDNIVSHAVTPTVVGTSLSITGAPADGEWQISYQYMAIAPKARVRGYLGGPSQDLYAVVSSLVGSAVVSTDKFAWDAALVCTFEFDTDAYPTGLPQVTALFRGAKVYDWRTGLTQWTENNALIAYDWARYAWGGNCAASEIRQATFTAAANACDVSTSFVTDAGTEVRPLYQCGIVIPLDGNPDEAMNAIVESMAGRWGWSGGQLVVRAGVYRAPVATIDESWITDVDKIQIVGQTPSGEKVNVLRPTISDAAQAYVAAPLSDVPADAYIAADGEELPREIQLDGVTRAVHAQHICGVLLREGREGLRVTLPCNLKAYPLELMDVVALNLPTFGWALKEFEVEGWNFSLTGGVRLVLRETHAWTYTPDALFPIAEASDNTYLQDPTAVEQLTITNVTSGGGSLSDGSALTRTTVTWSAAAAASVRRGGLIEVQYRESSSTAWLSAPSEAGTATGATIAALRMGIHHTFRVRALNALGVAGPWSLPWTHQVAQVTIETWQLANEAATETVDIYDAAGVVYSSLA